jgi:hypothetical protein
MNPRPRRWAVTLAAALVVAGAGEAQDPDPPGKNYALLVGINTYQAEGVRNLRFAAPDAKALAEVLRAKGYETIPLFEDEHVVVRRELIIGELTWLARVARPQDSVLIYFAGHGVRARHGTNEYTYWLARDTTLARLEIDGLRLNHVLDYIADIPARRKLVILDHCHSGKVDVAMLAPGESRDATAAPQLDTRNLFAVDEFEEQAASQSTEGTVFFGAARGDAFEFEDLQHGIFTHVLLQALKTGTADARGDRNGRLTVNELRSFVRPEVAAVAASKGVQQDTIDVVSGVNLDWELALVGSDEDALRAFLGKLEAQGGFDIQASVRYFTALGNFESARAAGIEPTAQDRQLVERLRSEMDLASVPLRDRARRLESFLAGL